MLTTFAGAMIAMIVYMFAVIILAFVAGMIAFIIGYIKMGEKKKWNKK